MLIDPVGSKEKLSLEHYWLDLYIGFGLQIVMAIHSLFMHSRHIRDCMI